MLNYQRVLVRFFGGCYSPNNIETSSNQQKTLSPKPHQDVMGKKPPSEMWPPHWPMIDGEQSLLVAESPARPVRPGHSLGPGLCVWMLIKPLCNAISTSAQKRNPRIRSWNRLHDRAPSMVKPWLITMINHDKPIETMPKLWYNSSIPKMAQMSVGKHTIHKASLVYPGFSREVRRENMVRWVR